MRLITKAGIFTLALSLFGAGFLCAQDRRPYPRGAILDEAAYNRLLRKAPLAPQSYEGLPKSFSLKQYAPLPGDQNDYGTCVAWASAYAARTISESVALDRKNQTETTRNVFSPVYIYRNIRPDDPNCRAGTQIFLALDLMKKTGAVKMLEIERTVEFPQIDLALYQDTRKYPIADYVPLFFRDDKSKPGLIPRAVKKSLTEGKPVIIGMNTPASFIEATKVWKPAEDPTENYGGHALCVVGYDDEKNGGSFEVMNSWGRKWGNGGFMWIPYTAFVDFVLEAYEIVENLSAYSDTAAFSGFIQVEILDEAGPQIAALEQTAPGFYRIAAPLRGETKIRFVAGSGESAYVYAFTASWRQDGDGGFYAPVQIFPQNGVSPLLNYRNSTIFLPGEDKPLVLDGAPGTEYLFLLYSKEALNLRDLMRRFEQAEGNPGQRLSAALGFHLMPPGAGYRENAAAFSQETADRRATAALMVAIDHW